MSDQPKLPLAVRAWRYYRRHGPRRLIGRIADQFRPAPAPHRPEYAGLPSSGAVESGPQAIHASLDVPALGALETSSSLLVQGWACADDGITSCTAWLDGRPAAELSHGYARPDVAEHLRHVAGSGQSGFSGSIALGELAVGAHRLEVVIEDGRGNRRIVQTFFRRLAGEALYDAYYHAILPTKNELAEHDRRLAVTGRPRIRLWLLGQPGPALAETLRSISAQRYPAWECRIVTSDATDPSLRRLVRDSVGRGHADSVAIARRQSDIVEEASIGDGYSGILAAGETLAPGALQRLAAAIGDGADVVYSDHDHAWPEDGRHFAPWLKPDWSPDYLLARDYVGGFYLFRDELRPGAAGAALAGAGDRGTGAWRYDLLLRLTDGPSRVTHVPHLLWSAPPASRGGDPEGELAAVVRTLQRRATGATVEPTGRPGIRRVRWPLAGPPTGPPKVTIIVPTTGKEEYVRPLVASLTLTEYPEYELLFVDNSRGRNPDGIEFLRSSGHRLIERDEPFNWAKLNNDAAREATGELLLFLNDDIEIVEPGWLAEMAGQASRPDVGAVGALLLYPEGTIQHAGVFFVAYGGGAVHLFHGLDPDAELYLDLQRVQREVAAVTGACLMVRRSLFEELGGFDERLKVAGNDVDLCLRLLARGLRNVWTPHARLVHHESATRRDASISADETTMWQLWGDWLRDGDPYHSPHFAKDRVDCAIDYRRLNDAAELPEGVNLIGYISAEMGVGEASRGAAAALKAADVPFAIVDYRHGNPSRMDDQSWADHVAGEPVYDVNLIYVNADQTPAAFARLPTATFSGRYTIGGWTWELPTFPDEWLESFAYVDEVWVPSEFVRAAVAAKAPVPVTVMPHAVRAPSGPFLDRATMGLPDGRYLFLTMYDVHSVRARKNPEGAIEAFLRAFTPDDPRAGLVVKVNNADRAERHYLDRLVAGRPNVWAIARTLSRHEVDSLLAACDCFVSLHRSEGFGLAIAEAMALAKPVIATNWSGNTDFMDEDTAACIGYDLVELDRDHGPYRAGSVWAEPDLVDASIWMARLVDDPEASQSLGRAAAEKVESTLSPAVVARRMDDRLCTLRGGPLRRSATVPEARDVPG